MASGFDPLGQGGLRAYLGPTNTGKTYRAIQRMLRHPSGMIGLPLRLLAQEIYDKLVAERGPEAVALVTGEQKRVPAAPRYWVCTVEAMPVDRPVSFLAVDEIQLAGSANRGHVFTDRLLNARGVRETLFLGSDSIEPLLRELVPTVEVERFGRLSTLRWSGARSIGRLPPRSAVVAFSANEVYELAERVRGRHGGTAVVLGALSPRARNAQVALYESGEVQHIVATDAIGMGLNMDLNHVSFSALRKFDGRGFRDLSPAELAQIAGRAGRHQRDGSFGTLSWLGPLDPHVIEAIEQHRFPPLRRLFWRNSELDFSSVEALLESLERPPPHPALRPVRDWSDHDALRALAREPDDRALLRSPEAVRVAWEVCQIPDFRKTLTGAHVGLLSQVLQHLLGPTRRLPEDWVAGRIGQLDRPAGDIDALMTRIAWVRTWNYIAYRASWLEDPRAWQARCQDIEDRLSDALHQQLTERFVTGRVRVVQVEGLPLPAAAPRAPQPPGGAPGARLRGLRYCADLGAPEPQGEVLRAVTEELSRRVEALLAAPDDALSVDARGALSWEDGELARLGPGETLLRPSITLGTLPYLREADEHRVVARLERWLAAWVGELMAPLRRPVRRSLSGPGRALVTQVEGALGCLPRSMATAALGGLRQSDRHKLARLDLRFGQETLYVAALLEPKWLERRALLWAAHEGLAARPEPPAAALVPRAPALPRGFYEAVGYQVLGRHAVRVDDAESLLARARGLARRGPFQPPQRWLARFNDDRDALRRVLLDLGFVPFEQPGRPPLYGQPQR